MLMLGGGLLALLLILPAVGFAILYWCVLPSDKLTPLIEREANKYLNGRLTCGRVELTFFETYPFLGIKANDGLIVSYASSGDSLTQQLPDAPTTDTLLTFREAVVSFRLLDYLFDSRIVIREVSLDTPSFHGYADEKGRANWDIFQSPDTSEKDTSALPPIDIQSVRINGGRFDYTDALSGLYAEAEDFALNVSGSLLAEGGNTFKVQTGCAAFFFENPTYTLANKTAWTLTGVVELRDNFQTVTFHEAELRLDNLPFSLEGSVSALPQTNSLAINIETSLQASDLNELLPLIPDAYFKNKKDLTAGGSVSLQATIVGELGDSIFPAVDAACSISNGAFSMKGAKNGIEALETVLALHVDNAHPNTSYISIEKLRMNGLNTSLDLTGKVTDLFQSPAVEARIKGSIDFTNLAQEFLNPDTLLLQGYITGDIQAAFLMNDLTNGHYDKINLHGQLTVDSLKAQSLPLNAALFLSDVRLTIDTADAGLLLASLQADSAHLNYGNDINAALAHLTMTAKTSPIIDTAAVAAISSDISCRQLRARLPDSVWLIAKNAALHSDLKPSASNKHIPTLFAAAKVDTLKYFAVPIRTGATFTGGELNIEALPYRDAIQQRRQAAQAAQSDSAKVATKTKRTRRTKRTPKDSTATATATEPSEPSLLRKWEARGNLSFERLRLNSRLFPLKMRMDRTNVAFDTNKILLSNAKLSAGNSDFTLTGEIHNIRRAALRGGTLKGNFQLSSDYINCNQLLRAVNRGIRFSEQKLSNAEANAVQTGNIEQLDALTQSDSITQDSANLLPIVPPFLDMALSLNARKIDYKDLQLEQVNGEVVLRNQSLNLKKLEMNSNIGQANLTMFYAASNPYAASAGFDIALQGVLVEKLLHLYPDIDSLLPMLRSFEGTLNCQLTASCNIDSALNIVLPSLNTTCFLQGKNITLLDGETFTQISRNLRFKNKQRNIIDSLAVDLAIHDNIIEVFPFLLDIDRYRAAISGTHNLDMSFNYHLSVLKSPLPFNLGLDVTGNLDKYKYKLVKCKFKDSFNPDQPDLILSKTSRRESILQFIQQQLRQNAPELSHLP